MTTDVLSVSPELSVRDAMALLASRHVSGAPVVTGGKVVGVISSTDLLDFAASLPGVPSAGAAMDVDTLESVAEQVDSDTVSRRLLTEVWVG
ncbi:MAG: CBS domain-containing protein, partial [Gemmatimonadaceae bacterium]